MAAFWDYQSPRSWTQLTLPSSRSILYLIVEFSVFSLGLYKVESNNHARRKQRLRARLLRSNADQAHHQMGFMYNKRFGCGVINGPRPVIFVENKQSCQEVNGSNPRWVLLWHNFALIPWLHRLWSSFSIHFRKKEQKRRRRVERLLNHSPRSRGDTFCR